MTPAAKAIRRFLKRNTCSSRALARRAGVEESTISHVLNGKRPAFSVKVSIRLHKVDPQLMPLSALLGLPPSAAKKLSGELAG